MNAARSDLSSHRRRILIIGADGLRPDVWDASLMPTVAQLAATGVRCRDHHAAYPSHTRVNMSTLATGATPGKHGIVANTMLAPFATDDHIVDTSDYKHLDALQRHSGGRALLVDSLGDILCSHGARIAVAGTGSPGSSLLWTLRDRGRIVNPNSTFGLADLYDLREKLGEVPPPSRGDPSARLQYATRAVADIFLDDPHNRVIVLWFSEPDASQHYFGLGSPEATASLRAVDTCVAHVLETLAQRGLRDQFDIFFISDHGHSTVAAHQTLREYLARAAHELGRPLPSLTTASDYVYAAPGEREPPAAELAPLVEWLLDQPWVGAILAGRDYLSSLPGVISLTQVWGDAPVDRWPLLAVSPRWSNKPNQFGVPGTVEALTTQSALRSSHGSASPWDMHAVLICNGPHFQSGVESTIPTGAGDLLPTILHILDLPVPSSLDGRVLWETLGQAASEPGDVREETIEPEHPAGGTLQAKLRFHQVGTTRYLHGALQSDV